MSLSSVQCRVLAISYYWWRRPIHPSTVGTITIYVCFLGDNLPPAHPSLFSTLPSVHSKYTLKVLCYHPCNGFPSHAESKPRSKQSLQSPNVLAMLLLFLFWLNLVQTHLPLLYPPGMLPQRGLSEVGWGQQSICLNRNHGNCLELRSIDNFSGRNISPLILFILVTTGW